MIVNETSLQGLLVIEPRCYRDERGFFLESYHEKRYKDAGIVEDFVQDNHSRSKKGVLRGMHFQIERPQAQIVTIMKGSVYYACIDIRRNSSTFGQWYGVELNDIDVMQLYMAPGFAGGFCVTSDTADIHYKVSEFYNPENEGGLLHDDPQVGIQWPSHIKKIINPRDKNYPLLSQLSF